MKKKSLWCVVLVVLAATLVVAQRSTTNGAYGGYLGSSAWFASMRQSAQNMEMLRRLGGGSVRQPVPPNYVEVAGEFVFPQGNPFPKGRLPNLRIKCNCGDSVERAPFIQQSGEAATFYTVLQRGQPYTFTWMYYFGGKEAFASYTVPGNAPKQIKVAFAIDGKGHGRVAGQAVAGK